MSLMEQVAQKALDMGVPLSVHMDLTYRCNEFCEHCYLEQRDRHPQTLAETGEMSTAEIKRVLDELASAGTFFLTLSGGELMLRHDFWEVLEHARRLMFCVKLKTNGLLIGDKEARRLAELAVDSVQISVYSHRAEVHDAITGIRGSLAQSLEAIRALRRAGVRVQMANVLMLRNLADYKGVQRLAEEVDAVYYVDPTITPMIDGAPSPLQLRIARQALVEIFRDKTLVTDDDEFCEVKVGEELDGYSCSAGHTAAYVNPRGDVFPCVQFPLPLGSLRRQSFRAIWNGSATLAELRSIKVKDLPTCSSCVHAGGCSRCPGLAYMEGDMRGASSADCEKSFARTGVLTANMRRKSGAGLVQIAAFAPSM